MNKARERNWSKARLMGITFNKSSFTSTELYHIHQIEKTLKYLKDNWDKNTEEHLGIKLKPLQCEWCRKRFDGKPLEKGEKYYCNKCLKLW
jgi:hypothetical protein